MALKGSENYLDALEVRSREESKDNLFRQRWGRGSILQDQMGQLLAKALKLRTHKCYYCPLCML
jgi:hypothetical protein